MEHAYDGGNLLLDGLPREERLRVSEGLSAVTLSAREAVAVADEPFEFLYFPIDAILSVVALFSNGATSEVGAVGREGFAPTEALVAARGAFRSSFCQVPGRVARMHRKTFEREIGSLPHFAALLQRNAAARLFTAEQLTACNITHTLGERCARWLLMTSDRVGRAEFPLTHEFLATMLGVRRAGVTEAAGRLQDIGAIRYRRGNITILDRELLIAHGCECYRSIAASFEAALAPLPAMRSPVAGR